MKKYGKGLLYLHLVSISLNELCQDFRLCKLGVSKIHDLVEAEEQIINQV